MHSRSVISKYLDQYAPIEQSDYTARLHGNTLIEQSCEFIIVIDYFDYNLGVEKMYIIWRKF